MRPAYLLFLAAAILSATIVRAVDTDHDAGKLCCDHSTTSPERARKRTKVLSGMNVATSR